MKTLIYSLLALTTPVLATPSVYEGFDMGAGPLGSGAAPSGESSAGWLSAWHAREGAPKVLKDDLALAGLESVPGLASSKGKTVVMRQLAQTFTGDAYGSFRVRGTQLKDNSMMGLLFSLPDADPVNPKTSLVSFLATPWAS